MTTERRAFDWLSDASTRRGGLSRIQTAIAHGHLEGPELADRRAALVRALNRLARDPEVTPLELVKIGRILLAMSTGDLTLARTPRKPRNRCRRR